MVVLVAPGKALCTQCSSFYAPAGEQERVIHFANRFVAVARELLMAPLTLMRLLIVLLDRSSISFYGVICSTNYFVCHHSIHVCVQLCPQTSQRHYDIILSTPHWSPRLCLDISWCVVLLLAKVVLCLFHQVGVCPQLVA